MNNHQIKYEYMKCTISAISLSLTMFSISYLSSIYTSLHFSLHINKTAHFSVVVINAPDFKIPGKDTYWYTLHMYHIATLLPIHNWDAKCAVYCWINWIHPRNIVHIELSREQFVHANSNIPSSFALLYVLLYQSIYTTAKWRTPPVTIYSILIHPCHNLFIKWL